MKNHVKNLFYFSHDTCKYCNFLADIKIIRQPKTLAISRKNRGTIEVPRFFQLVEARGVEPLSKIAKSLVISTLYFLLFSISCENVLFFPTFPQVERSLPLHFSQKTLAFSHPIAYTISAGRNTLYTRVNELTFKRHFLLSSTGPLKCG